MINRYGDITPRTAGYVIATLLKRAIPYMVLENFGQTYVLPTNSTTNAIFRRYEPLDNTPNFLQEGVTPAGKTLRKTDVSCTLSQLGDLIELTDIIMDTHEDPVLMESTDILAEQSAQMIERLRYGVVRAGTNVTYANGSLRSQINTPISTSIIRRAVRGLERQNARKLTKVVRPTADFATVPLAPAYVAICHPDLDPDVRSCSGYKDPANYTTYTPWENEIGAIEKVRILTSTLFDSFKDAGAASGSTYISNAGASCDVYPIIIFGADAYGIVPLKGQQSITPMVVNPRPAPGDGLGQRGTVGWKTMQGAIILQDLWMMRIEVAASA